MLDEVQDESLEAIRTWVSEQLGLHFEHERAPMFGQRLAALGKKLGLTFAQIRAGLDRGERDLAIALAEELSTNHTMFLREPESFALLTETILPSLPTTGELRMWSAAASSGEEAYSIAICASELLGPLAAERVRILGTDISERQIRHAERGVFERRSVAEHAPRLLPYFEAVGPARLRVRPEIAAMCVFRRLSLTQERWPFQLRFHVIFLRNVLYYFDAEVRRRVLEACFRAAEPGGWLVTSVTEPMLNTQTSWVRLGPAVLRKPGWSS